MIVSSKAIERISQILYGQSRHARTETVQAQSPMKRDEVTLSSKGQEMQALQRRLAETSEVRKERVEALRAAIQRGDYNVSAEKIAEKIMQHYD